MGSEELSLSGRMSIRYHSTAIESHAGVTRSDQIYEGRWDYRSPPFLKKFSRPRTNEKRVYNISEQWYSVCNFERILNVHRIARTLSRIDTQIDIRL